MTLTLEMLFIIGGGILSLLVFWLTVMRWVSMLLRQRDEAIAALRRDHSTALDLVRRDLDDFKLQAVKDFATSHELGQSLGRIESALVKLNERLDRYLEGPRDRPSQTA